MGYVSESSALVDPQFQNDELQSWLETRKKLSVLGKGGVYDKLLQGGEPEKPAFDVRLTISELESKLKQLQRLLTHILQFVEKLGLK